MPDERKDILKICACSSPRFCATAPQRRHAGLQAIASLMATAYACRASDMPPEVGMEPVCSLHRPDGFGQRTF